MANPAQAEFDELMRDKDHRGHHPEDDYADKEELSRTTTRDTTNTSIAMPRSSISSARDYIPRTRYGANTGPKGVIADAQDFREQKRIHRLGSSRVSLASERAVEPVVPTFGQELRAEQLAEVEEQGNELEEDEDEDELDDDFVAQWRQGRMQELRNGVRSTNMVQHKPAGKAYGGVTSVDAQGYLDAIDGSGPDNVVVVYIYDDMSQVSQLFETCLRTLSHKHERTRFVKLHFADAEMEPAGVPALIAYRGGDKFAALVPIIEEMPADGELDALTLESVLKRHQILT